MFRSSLLLFYFLLLFLPPAFLEQTCCFVPLCSYFICNFHSGLLIFWSKPAVSFRFAPILFSTSIPASCFFGANLLFRSSLLLFYLPLLFQSPAFLEQTYRFSPLCSYFLIIIKKKHPTGSCQLDVSFSCCLSTTYIHVYYINLYNHKHCNTHVQYLYLQSLQFSYSVFTLANIAMLIHLFTSPRTGRVPAVSPLLSQAKRRIRDTP